MLLALANRDFRLLFIGLTITTTGYWMVAFAQGWLLVQIAVKEGNPHLAPFYLGVIALARAFPGIVAGLCAGIASDPFDRRKVQLVANGAGAAVSLVLAAVTVLDVVNAPILIVLSV